MPGSCDGCSLEERATQTTSKPAPARSAHSRRPIPRLAPVTTATRLGIRLLPQGLPSASPVIGTKRTPKRVSREQAWEDIPLTETAIALADYKIARLTADYPFTVEPGRLPAPPSGSVVLDLAARRAKGDSWLEVQKELLLHYQRQQEPRKAALVAALISEAVPGRAQPRHAAGQLYLQAGDTDLALYYLRRAVALAPRETRFRLSLAQAHFIRQEYAESLAALNEVLRVDPKNQPAAQYRALVQQHLAEPR